MKTIKHLDSCCCDTCVCVRNLALTRLDIAEKKECIACTYSGVDDAVWVAHGCPACTCTPEINPEEIYLNALPENEKALVVTAQYAPWVEMGITEVDYWKQKYIHSQQMLNKAHMLLTAISHQGLSDYGVYSNRAGQMAKMLSDEYGMDEEK